MSIHIDGASRGNPGYSGIGIVITRDNDKIAEYKEFIGMKTNNQAEYLALKKALEIASSIDDEITVLSDSELVINQRTNKYKVRNKQLKSAIQGDLEFGEVFQNRELQTYSQGN